jgi:vacuolar-type H+-ATPase subunit C/Vma6
MRQLIQQGPESIGVSIGEMGYRAEMDLYASRMSGADAIEAALFHNMDNDLAEVLRFCQGRLKSIVAIYIERFDYEKAKTVLRAVNGGASDKMIEDQILPIENPRNTKWINIVRNTEGLQEAVEAMSGTPWGQTLNGLDAEASLEEMENSLDLEYFANALKIARGKDGGPRLLRYLRMEIDHRNIINEFRAIRMGMSVEKRLDMLIPGGKIDRGTMKQACQAENDEELIEALRRSNSFDDSGFEDAREKSEKSGSLDSYADLLSHQRHAVLRRFAHLRTACLWWDNKSA